MKGSLLLAFEMWQSFAAQTAAAGQQLVEAQDRERVWAAREAELAQARAEEREGDRAEREAERAAAAACLVAPWREEGRKGYGPFRNFWVLFEHKKKFGVSAEL